MKTFIMLTRLVSEETNPSFAIRKKEGDVVANIEKHIPLVRWVNNFSVLGPWDYLDIFQAPDMETAMKVSALVRYYGGAHTEVWSAVEWSHFKDILQELTESMEK